VRAIILRAAGTNCDLETQHAWSLAGAVAERVHLQRVIDNPALLDQCQILTIPGGFSYGDDISAGRIFAARLQRYLTHHLHRFITAGKLVLGICNGFQILVKAGLLPDPLGTGRDRPRLTVTYNDPPGFQDRWVCVRGCDTPCVFTESGRTYEMPIAHGEGRVLCDSPASLASLVSQGLDALRYCPPPTVGGPPLPPNPNGSQADIAGLCDPTGRVLGLMPHPERFVAGTQHPRWTSLPRRAEGDGLALFRAALRYFA
jgi:phosphoribosylformylglycinamidine synthase